MCRSSHRPAHEERRSSARPAGPMAAPGPVSTPDHVRVSDAERDAVIAELRRHVGEGRLTLEEFEERTDEVVQARTGAELRATLRELPPPAPPPPARAHRRRTRARLGAGVPPWAVIAAVVTLAVVVHPVFWWGFFLLFFVGKGPCAMGGRHHARPRSARRDDELTYV